MISPDEDLSMESSQQRCWQPVAHCGLTDLFQGSDINSPHPARSDVDGTCAKMLNFSQQGAVYASQEFGYVSARTLVMASSCICRCINVRGCSTQDFATPHHGAKPQASQNMSQPVVVPALAFGAPPTFDGAGKRARVQYECGPSQGMWGSGRAYNNICFACTTYSRIDQFSARQLFPKSGRNDWTGSDTC